MRMPKYSEFNTIDEISFIKNEEEQKTQRLFNVPIIGEGLLQPSGASTTYQN